MLIVSNHYLLADAKSRSSLGDFSSRITSNAKNPPMSQRGSTPLDTPDERLCRPQEG